MKLVLPNFSWAAVVALIWELKALVEKKHPVPWGRLIAAFAIGVFEQVTRDVPLQRSFLKRLPSTEDIDRIFRMLVPYDISSIGILHEGSVLGRALAAKNASDALDGLVANGIAGEEAPTLVNWQSRNATVCRVRYVLASWLNEHVSREAGAKFLAKFFDFGSRRLTESEAAGIREMELQAGFGMLAAICHAKNAVPHLDPVHFAGCLLRKYGIPDADGVHSCHWCGGVPCFCGGRKGSRRKVTLEDGLAQAGTLTPWDTMWTMRLAYGLARNPSIAGAGYGPIRAAAEMQAESVVGCIYLESGTIEEFRRVLGPLCHDPQQHIGEIIKVATEGKKTPLEHALDDIADGVHWQPLMVPEIDQAAGLVSAIREVAKFLGVEVEMPPLPEMPAIYRS